MSVSLRELYPSGAPSLESHNELLHRHARKLESGIERDIAMNQRHIDLVERVDNFEEKHEKWRDKNDAEMGEQTKVLLEIRLGLAAKDGEVKKQEAATKRSQVWVTLAAPLLAVLGTLLTSYLSRPAQGPGPIHLTSEQIQQLKDNEAAAKR